MCRRTIRTLGHDAKTNAHWRTKPHKRKQSQAQHAECESRSDAPNEMLTPASRRTVAPIMRDRAHISPTPRGVQKVRLFTKCRAGLHNLICRIMATGASGTADELPGLRWRMTDAIPLGSADGASSIARFSQVCTLMNVYAFALQRQRFGQWVGRRRLFGVGPYKTVLNLSTACTADAIRQRRQHHDINSNTSRSNPQQALARNHSVPFVSKDPCAHATATSTQASQVTPLLNRDIDRLHICRLCSSACAKRGGALVAPVQHIANFRMPGHVVLIQLLLGVGASPGTRSRERCTSKQMLALKWSGAGASSTKS